MSGLKDIRIKVKEMSQWKLAQESKVHQSRISLIENGLVEATEDEKKKLAKALNVPVSEIFPEVEVNASGPTVK